MKMTARQFLVLLTVTALALVATNPARAEALFVPIVDGKAFISPPPPPDERLRIRPNPQALPFRVTASKVDVRVEDNVATTTMEQSFLNQTGRDLEVRVLIPLPAGAAINNSALSMGDQMVEGTLRNAAEAQSIYESIVNQRRDPALLRFAGENLYEARVFPIPPNQERRLKFSYTQMVTSTAGLYDYKHILSGSQMYQNGIEKFDFTCTIRSKSALGPVYSPSHQVAVQRPDDKTAVIKLSGTNLSSDRDFRLYYSPSDSDVALRMLAHRSGDSEDGYFMLIGRADDQLEKSRILPKEVVFVVDVSGSMQGEKIEQTKKALKFCLNTLNERDRFNLITFSTDVQALSNGNLLDATKENIAKGLAAVDQIEASGGTNIDGALRAALGSDFTEGPAKAKAVIFMTDGLPTVGVTDAASILQGVDSGNKKSKARIFNFGVGNDVNTHLLDKMALDYDGVSSYVSQREDIEVKVSDFANKIRHPVMTDVSFDFGANSSVTAVYPKRIPAMYRGGELIVIGRFKGAGPGQITLTGNVAGEVKRIPLNITWPARDLDSSYLPRVWAMRKIGHLIEDIRLHGHNQEIINEITQLAQRHGIVTPYTSQLVLEPGMQPDQFGGGWGGRRRELFDRDGRGVPPPASKPGEALARNEEAKKAMEQGAANALRSAQQATTGATATAVAEFERDLKEALPAAPADAPAKGKDAVADEKRRKFSDALKADKSLGIAGDAEEAAEVIAKSQSDVVKQVGARTFYNRGGVWVDSAVKPDAKPTVVKAFSKEYFELLKADTTLGPVLALGKNIIVVANEKVYQIEE